MQTWFWTIMAMYFISSLYYTQPRSILPSRSQSASLKTSKLAKTAFLKQSGFSPTSMERSVVHNKLGAQKQDLTNNITKRSVGAYQGNHNPHTSPAERNNNLHSRTNLMNPFAVKRKLPKPTSHRRFKYNRWKRNEDDEEDDEDNVPEKNLKNIIDELNKISDEPDLKKVKTVSNISIKLNNKYRSVKKKPKKKPKVKPSRKGSKVSSKEATSNYKSQQQKAEMPRQSYSNFHTEDRRMGEAIIVQTQGENMETSRIIQAETPHRLGNDYQDSQDRNFEKSRITLDKTPHQHGYPKSFDGQEMEKSGMTQDETPFEQGYYIQTYDVYNRPMNKPEFMQDNRPHKQDYPQTFDTKYKNVETSRIMQNNKKITENKNNNKKMKFLKVYFKEVPPFKGAASRQRDVKGTEESFFQKSDEEGKSNPKREEDNCENDVSKPGNSYLEEEMNDIGNTEDETVGESTHKQTLNLVDDSPGLKSLTHYENNMGNEAAESLKEEINYQTDYKNPNIEDEDSELMDQKRKVEEQYSNENLQREANPFFDPDQFKEKKDLESKKAVVAVQNAYKDGKVTKELVENALSEDYSEEYIDAAMRDNSDYLQEKMTYSKPGKREKYADYEDDKHLQDHLVLEQEFGTGHQPLYYSEEAYDEPYQNYDAQFRQLSARGVSADVFEEENDSQNQDFQGSNSRYDDSVSRTKQAPVVVDEYEEDDESLTTADDHNLKYAQHMEQLDEQWRGIGAVEEPCAEDNQLSNETLQSNKQIDHNNRAHCGDNQCELDYHDPITTPSTTTTTTEEPCQYHKEKRPVHYVSLTEVEQLIQPNQDGSIITLGNIKLDEDSFYLHRIFYQYYYEVILIDIGSLPSPENKTSYYQEFNRNVCILITRFLKSSVIDNRPEITRRNYFLERLQELAHRHRNQEYPDVTTLPQDDDVYIGHCIKYTTYETMWLHPTHRIMTNSGPLNIPNQTEWVQNGCPEFFENSNSHVAPEDDNEGINIAPPKIAENNRVKFRGPKHYTERDLYRKKKLLLYYRCMMMKINSIPNRPERLCYFSQFHRRFLRFIKRYRNKLGKKPWYKIDDAFKWFDHRKEDSRSGKSITHWEADRIQLIKLVEDILSEGNTAFEVVSNIFKFSWKSLTQLSKQKLVAIFGCIFLMLLLVIITGYNLQVSIMRRRRLSKELNDPETEDSESPEQPAPS